jgi:pimeloyl-ACP methyl ester carboxylesterase
MARQTYALLVGINQYTSASDIPSLRGCLNDVDAMQTYLQTRLGEDSGRVHIKTLLNEQARREAVIEGFRNHLCQAESGDVAIFFYAGHGAQENAPEEFWHLEPDRLDETLVCYDSRCDGSWDLADKELAKLIAEVADKNPHIVVILDCCHSGTATRGTLTATKAVRRAPMDKRQRPLSSFIVTPDELPALPTVTHSFGFPTSGWHIPHGRHVLLAACRDIEEAKEYAGEGKHRGAFSYFLLDTLYKANGVLTYRDVFKRCSTLLQNRVMAQSPQLEATLPDDLDQPFLGGAIQPRLPHFTVSCDRTYGWVIDGGVIHGIAPPVAGETTMLALFPAQTPDSALGEALPVGTASVTAVLPGLSQVQVAGVGDLQPEMIFKAVIKALPLPPMGVHVVGDGMGVSLLREAIAHAGDNFQQASLYVYAVDDPLAATFQVLVQDNQYAIKRPADDRMLLEPTLGYSPASASKTVRLLEHLARWTTTLELQSSPTSRIAPNAVQIDVVRPGQHDSRDSLRLIYSEGGAQPTFLLRLRNTSQQRLYCAVLNLNEWFAISAALFEAGGMWLNPGEEAYALGGKPVYASVPRELWEQGITEFRDVLKLIVSTTAFDARLLEQGKLNLYQGEARDTYREDATRSLHCPPKGMLNRLMQRVQTRDLGDAPEDEVADDWMTTQITLTTIRPRETVTLSAATPQAQPLVGVLLQSPAGFAAQARLTTVSQSTRDLGHHILPPLLRDQTQPFQFIPSRATDPGLSALELRDVQHREAITPENPLTVVADVQLESGAVVLPVAYDGEFYLPLGRGLAKGNQTRITIEHLPEPLSEGQRSLGGAIRIFFQKVVTKKLGLELSQKLGVTFNYPLLAIAEVSHGEVNYIVDPAIVAQRVAQAQRVALYIHGIIGDTQSMVPSIETAVATLEGEAKPLKDCYDLVLAFDYESLNTPIGTHARGLKKRLREVGLGPNHGKILHIIAHSMGGLVSRWFIEQEGGNEVVQHLILLGTPSAGSPWPQVQAGLTAMTAFVINGLSTVAFPLRVLGALLEKIEDIDVTLDEMEPDSEFLQELATSDDPSIPYTVIAGNTSLITGLPDTLKGKLVARLKSLMKLPFYGVPNDLAVTVESIKAIPAGRRPTPVMVEVGCDHLVYFTDPAGVKTLGSSIQDILSGAVEPGAVASQPGLTALPPALGLEANIPEPLQDRESLHDGAKAKVLLLWWVMGAIALILTAIFGLRLLKLTEPTTETSPQSYLGLEEHRYG